LLATKKITKESAYSSIIFPRPVGGNRLRAILGHIASSIPSLRVRSHYDVDVEFYGHKVDVREEAHGTIRHPETSALLHFGILEVDGNNGSGSRFLGMKFVQLPAWESGRDGNSDDEISLYWMVEERVGSYCERHLIVRESERLVDAA